MTARWRALHLNAGAAVNRPETLAVKEPLELRVNGTSVTVTMRTLGSDFELSQGFQLTEGVITRRGAPPGLDVTRNFYTTSSCGVCGKASLDAVRVISSFSPGMDPVVVSADTLEALPGRLQFRARGMIQHLPVSTGTETLPTPRTPPR